MHPPAKKMLSTQGHLERPGVVAHQSHRSEQPPKRNEGSKHPVLASNGCHGSFVLVAVGEKASAALESLAANGELNLRRLLNVANPLAVHVRGADIEPVAIHNEPDRNLVSIPGLASAMGQSHGLVSRYPPQSCHFGPFHKLSFRWVAMDSRAGYCPLPRAADTSMG